MPDPARTADAKVLEVPVTIQGSKIIEATGQRELFTETTKTTLIFDNGAAVSLQARVVAGQSLFLRNEVTGREILCRVIESPSNGQTGATDLEFTVPEAGFWDATPEEIQAAAEKIAAEKSVAEPTKEVKSAEAPAEKSGAQNQEHVDSTLAMMGSTAAAMTVPPARLSVQEELMASHEAAPGPTTAPSAAPKPEAHDAVVSAHEQPNVQTTFDAKQREEGPEFNLAKFEDTLAALLDGDVRRAKRTAAAKEKEAARPGGDAAQPAPDEPVAATEIQVPAVPTWARIEHLLTTGKGAVISVVTASLVIVVCLFLIWRAIYYPAEFGASLRVATALPAPVKPKIPLPVGPQKPGTKPATAAAATPAAAVKSPTNGANAHVAESAAKPKLPATQPPAIPVAKNPVTASAPAAEAHASEPVVDASAETGPRIYVGHDRITSDSVVPERHSKPGEVDAGNIPARIVSEVQPTFPSWAKELDVDGVVKLDATIDAGGNVTQMKVLSGPRPLQHAAQQAVGLWIFEPAKANGAPVVSHMILTVEFQR